VDGGWRRVFSLEWIWTPFANDDSKFVAWPCSRGMLVFEAPLVEIQGLEMGLEDLLKETSPVFYHCVQDGMNEK